MDGFWNKFKGVYLRGHGRSLSFWGLLSRVMCPWLPWQILGKNCNFRDNLSSNGWISMKLCSCNVFRAWTLPFGFGPDICSYLPLAKFRVFCNFRDNLSSNGWISMKLCSCNVVRAWTLPFGFGPDICSYLPLAKFHGFCIFRDNLSSNKRMSTKLCSCKALRAWMLPFSFWTWYLELSALGKISQILPF